MQFNKVEICGVNTSELVVLSESEKERLLKMTKQGDKNARDQLISGNLKLVLSVVQRFGGRGENPDDLFQVGCIGLIKAIDNFDTSHEVKFSTYAVPMNIIRRMYVNVRVLLEYRIYKTPNRKQRTNLKRKRVIVYRLYHVVNNKRPQICFVGAC